MNRLVVGSLVTCFVVAGCLGAPIPGAGPADPGTVEQGSASVEYVVRAGTIAESVAHVYVDFAVYFAERPDDVYACTDGAPLMDNKYDPTPTPLPTVAGDCAQSEFSRIDIATLNGSQSIGRFDESAGQYGGHTLVVHDVTVVLDNGTTASDVYDTDFRAVTEREPPSGTYGVEVSVTDYTGSNKSLGWHFGIDTERFNPDEW